MQRGPATLELALAAVIPSILLSLGLGSVAARYQNRLPDVLMQVVAFLGWAVPPFIVGLFLIKIFYSRLHWFPPGRLSVWAGEIVNSEAWHSVTGLYTVDAVLNGNMRLFLDALQHLVLPAASLAVVEWALLMRIMRSSILETMNLDYIVTARAKGLSERQVISHHARRNALLPVISTTGVAMATLINSIIVVETIFSINGVGRWAAQAIMSTDIPVAIGFALFCSLVVALSSLVADILYGVVDPRVSLQ
jgi:peptide/nickel transport system permease protein